MLGLKLMRELIPSPPDCVFVCGGWGGELSRGRSWHFSVSSECFGGIEEKEDCKKSLKKKGNKK